MARLQGQGLPPWAVMALNNMIMSYVTCAPMYRELLGQDPFTEPALAKQLELVMTVFKAVIEYHPEAQ